jgi:flagellar assembly protein FliH
MAHNVRFLFDRHFAPLEPSAAGIDAPLPAAEPDAGDGGPGRSPISPVYGEEDLARAHAEGIAFGRELAAAEAVAGSEQLLRQTLAAVAGQLAAALDALNAADVAAAHRASRIALAVVRKLFPQLQARTALAEVERVVLTVMARVLDQPHLTVRVAAAVREEAAERLQELALREGFDGRVSVTGDEGLAVGDCRVTWAGGGVVRDGALLWQEIDAIVEQTFGRELADDGCARETQAVGQLATV